MSLLSVLLSVTPPKCGQPYRLDRVRSRSATCADMDVEYRVQTALPKLGDDIDPVDLEIKVSMEIVRLDVTVCIVCV